MMHHDLTKLAADMLQAHHAGMSMRLPAMTMRDIATLTLLLRQLDTPVSNYAH